MAPAQGPEHTVDAAVGDRRANHNEGIISGPARGTTSPVLGEDRDHAPHRAKAARTGFASAGGWVSFS